MTGIGLAAVVGVGHIADAAFIYGAAVAGKTAIGLTGAIECGRKEADAYRFAWTGGAVAALEGAVASYRSGVAETITQGAAVGIGRAGVANTLAASAECAADDDHQGYEFHHRGTILATERETSSFPIGICTIL